MTRPCSWPQVLLRRVAVCFGGRVAELLAGAGPAELATFLEGIDEKLLLEEHEDELLGGAETF